jgi:hypothetical protein
VYWLHFVKTIVLAKCQTRCLNMLVRHHTVSTNHTSTIATSLGKFIYIVGTKRKFNFGAYVNEQTLKHVPIAFPSIICGVILNQHPDILVSTDVVSKRESPLSLHPKL